MGNTWSYEIVLQESRQLSPDLFRQVLALASIQQYRVHYPACVTSVDGLRSLEFSDDKTLTAYICSQGGRFPIWRGDDDIGITCVPPRRRLSLGVLHDLRKGSDEQKAHDLETLFLALCKRLQPHVGYSCDEWRLETAFPGTELLAAWDKFEHSIASGNAPLLLFWLNYFETNYFQSIGEWRFDQVNHRKLLEAEQGVYIYLADKPWDAPLAILKEDGRYHVIYS